MKTLVEETCVQVPDLRGIMRDASLSVLVRVAKREFGLRESHLMRLCSFFLDVLKDVRAQGTNPVGVVPNQAVRADRSVLFEERVLPLIESASRARLGANQRFVFDAMLRMLTPGEQETLKHYLITQSLMTTFFVSRTALRARESDSTHVKSLASGMEQELVVRIGDMLGLYLLLVGGRRTVNAEPTDPLVLRSDGKKTLATQATNLMRVGRQNSRSNRGE